jgi:hypothetical protein
MGRDGNLDNAVEARRALESELALLNEELRKLTMNSPRRNSRRDKGGR